MGDSDGCHTQTIREKMDLWPKNFPSLFLVKPYTGVTRTGGRMITCFYKGDWEKFDEDRIQTWHQNQKSNLHREWKGVLTPGRSHLSHGEIVLVTSDDDILAWKVCHKESCPHLITLSWVEYNGGLSWVELSTTGIIVLNSTQLNSSTVVLTKLK